MRISKFHSIRKIAKSRSLNRTSTGMDSGISANNETDSNADTCCPGKNWSVYSYTYCSADVHPYEDSYAPIKDVPIVSGATAFTDDNGVTYILIIHEALYYGDKLDHSLINPNQLRHNNVGYWDNPYDKDKPLGIDVTDDLFIPLYTKGTKILFQSRTPKPHLINCI